MPSSLLEHLNHLSIEIEGHEYSDEPASFGEFSKTVQALQATKNLKKLEIETDDTKWLSIRPASRQAPGRRTQFKKMAQIPGMGELAELAANVGSFNLRGEALELRKISRL